MTLEAASRISRWAYPEPYAMYGMDGEAGSVLELMNGDYELAVDQRGELIGFICTKNSARVPGGYAVGIYEDPGCVDLGLGLDPGFTGRGLGSEFVIESVRYVVKHSDVQQLQLVVASFNKRAIKVYTRVGFKAGIRFQSSVSGNEIEFMSMRLTVRAVDRE
ncbi:GNAT family N-acetyltransferase [Paenibacillus mendelii]|uniref:GNAT family N-acetyltransferase n=1 Tax=Paenibacillus mendelii TaxID=206163 RepID=A0ABV6JDA1_9BACL|nr:GNAT family N-acetyltransferase [Paenibacillus mendelii]MCQ6560769.1 GNAT family N-acetyltransferase [Paenibacillus mendelii]